MKSDVIKRPLPASPEEWEQLISAAPGEKAMPTPDEEQAFWGKAVVVRQGGPKAVSNALKLKRTGGHQNFSIKQPVSIRLSPDVAEYFKSTGKGWQTRVNEVLQSYVKAHR